KNYTDEIPQRTKDARVAELMAVQQSVSEELNSNKIGKIYKVIIDRREGEFFTGRTEYDSPEVDNEVLISTEYDLHPGEFHDILITGSAEFDLYGKPVK
ncbi:MAG: 30S ribosomal protein S12 methylthiotransferase RimO, partial [Bacteroidales bacterium]|nr:30S ribosomal protein S12 methylthiotransferase RimO [Bacteroidales bacterium]